VRKCEELYDMSNKKYSDSVWRKIGEELKNSGKFHFYFIALLKLLSFYYHRSSNN